MKQVLYISANECILCLISKSLRLFIKELKADLNLFVYGILAIKVTFRLHDVSRLAEDTTHCMCTDSSC